MTVRYTEFRLIHCDCKQGHYINSGVGFESLVVYNSSWTASAGTRSISGERYNVIQPTAFPRPTARCQFGEQQRWGKSAHVFFPANLSFHFGVPEEQYDFIFEYKVGLAVRSPTKFQIFGGLVCISCDMTQEFIL